MWTTIFSMGWSFIPPMGSLYIECECATIPPCMLAPLKEKWTTRSDGNIMPKLVAAIIFTLFSLNPTT
jgi:hypothetical protein